MRKAVLFVLICFLFLTSSNCLEAADLHYTQSGYIAAISETYLDKAIEYIVQGDNAALSTLIAQGVVVPLKAGIPVYITEYKMFSGKMKFRPKGSTYEYWTVAEAIK